MQMLLTAAALCILCGIKDVSSAKGSGIVRRYLMDTSSWGPWGKYSVCSATCGSAYRQRSRICQANYHCVGASNDLMACHLPPCPDCVDKMPDCSIYYAGYCVEQGQKIPWMAENCAKHCRYCTDTKTTMAPTPAPYIALNGGWSTWSSFSACSKTCGPGTMYRSRSCTNPAPSRGGSNCNGVSSESYTCYVQACPTKSPYTDWGPWSAYGTCSVTCGAGEAVRERYRYCTDRSQCKLIDYDRTKCTQQPCPIDGRWGPWNGWSKCSMTCDLGVISRSRLCNNPAPTHGGANCTGDKVNSKDCTMGQCPTWTHWFDGSCSASCGTGTRDRLRHCSTGRDIDCTGKPTQVVPCKEAICV